MFWMQHDPSVKRGSLPRMVRVRRGTVDDEFATFEVMRKTMGHDMTWTHHVAARRHLQNAPNVSFWVAEEKQRFGSARVVGYARSVVRDRVWSLTEFFVLPGHHRQGIGSALLAHCHEEGEELGADTRFVLASHHPGADSLYVRKLGCFPRIPMMLLVGSLSKLRALDTEAAPILDTALPLASPAVSAQAILPDKQVLRAEPLDWNPQTEAALERLDREIVGYARTPEHIHWAREMGGPTGASRLFRRLHPAQNGPAEPGEIVGYAYIGPHSSGPMLAVDPADQPRMLAHVATVSRALAHADSEFDMIQPIEQYLAVPGTNETVLRWLLECGWQIVFHYLFMSSRTFGSQDRYVGHNPLYFL